MSFELMVMKAWTSLAVVMPAIIIAIVLALILLAVLLSITQNLKMDSPVYKWVAILYGLRYKECIAVAAAYCKFIFVAYFVLSFSDISLVHYMFIAVAALICIIFGGVLKNKIMALLWIFCELIMLFAEGMIKNYMTLFDSSVIFRIIYWTVAVFVAVFSLFVFINEVNDIAQNRKVISL